MFTGLIEAVGEVVELKAASGGLRLRVQTDLSTELAPGDSLAVNGVCLTAIACDRSHVHFDVGPETLRVTNLGALVRGSRVNLERPLRADHRFGGHFVQGHVDALGQIVDWRGEGDYRWLTVSFPVELRPYIIPKGSIAIDGISLTVAGLGDLSLDVMIIPATLANTTLQKAGIGDRVNIECDMLGKYVVRAAELAGLSLTPVPAGETRH
jgi:riboflavin synthase